MKRMNIKKHLVNFLLPCLQIRRDATKGDNEMEKGVRACGSDHRNKMREGDRSTAREPCRWCSGDPLTMSPMEER